MPEKVSRREFLKTAAKTAAIAGGAGLVGSAIGFSALRPNEAEAAQATQTAAVSATDPDSAITSTSPYTPKERWFFLHTTDGIAWLPQSKFGLSRRPILVYGYAKPISDTFASGQSVGNVGAAGVGPPTKNDMMKHFADINWIDGNTNLPVMLGKAQLTGPPIWGVEGDILDISLFNLGFGFTDIMDPHTIHLHGVHAPNYYDGIPEISFGIPMYDFMEDGPATLDTFEKFQFTYRMFCERPGTYMYHCHVEASEHVQMGMYGPMWIYPKQYGNVATGGAAYNNYLTRFSQEAILLHSEFDSRWHDSIVDLSQWPDLSEPDPATIRANPPTPIDPSIINFDIPHYTPNYWLVNGRSLPDTLLAGKYDQSYHLTNDFTKQNGLNGNALQLSFYPTVTSLTMIDNAPVGWPTPRATPVQVPRQPVQTYVQTAVTEKVLVRLSNMGFQYQPEHFHGVMPMIVGKDTFAWVPQPNNMFSTPSDERRRIFTQGIFSGETYDLIASYPDKAAISPRVYGFINASTPTAMPFSASEIGVESPPLPPGFNYADAAHTIDPSMPIASGLLPANVDADVASADGYYKGYPLLYLWHVHDDYRVTNDGDYPGGAVTVVKVNKAGTNKPKSSIIITKIPV